MVIISHMHDTVPMFKPNHPPSAPGDYTMLPVSVRMDTDPRYTGRGVTMAFIDSGFYPHPDLANRVRVHVDATSSRIITGRRFHDPADYAWHGQMTTVVAAGDGTTSNGRYIGIAREAELVLIKVSTRRLQIKEPDILRGLRWLIAHHREFNVKVCNISVGGDYVSNDPAHPLHKCVEQLIAEGVTILVAAGNSGQEFLVPPASAPGAITIGGVDDQNTLDRTAWKPYRNNYSRTWEGAYKPEVTAIASWIPSPIMPGTWVAREAKWLAAFLHSANEYAEEATYRILIERCYDQIGVSAAFAYNPTAATWKLVQDRIVKHKVIDADYQHVDGTSVSTAIASSIVAQLVQVNPRLTPPQIKEILMRTAEPLSGIGFEQQGAGMINSKQAVALAESW